MERRQKRTIALALLLLVLIVTAVFVVIILNKEYTLTFNSQNGTQEETMLVHRNDKNNPKKNKLPEPIRPGWTFMGWTTTPNSKDYHHTAQNITKSTSLYAQWEPNSYVVNLHSDAERVDSIPLGLNEIRDGITAFSDSWILPDQSIRTFDGWMFTDATGNEAKLEYSKATEKWKFNGVEVGVENPFKPYLYDNNIHALWTYKSTTLVFLNAKGANPASQYQYKSPATFNSTVDLSWFNGGKYVGWRIDSTQIKNATLNVSLTTGAATSESKLSTAQLAKVNSVLNTTYSPGQTITIDSTFAHLATKATSNPLITDSFEVYLYPVFYDEIFSSQFYYEGMLPIQNAKVNNEDGIWLINGKTTIAFNRSADPDVTKYYYFDHKTKTRKTVEFGSTLAISNFHSDHATIFYAERKSMLATIEFDIAGGLLIRDLKLPDSEKSTLAGVEAAFEESVNKPIGSTFKLPSATMFAKFNKTFIGWQETELDGTKGRIFRAGTDYTIRADLADNEQRVYTLTAVWVDSRVNLLFDLDGGFGFDITESMRGESVILPQKEDGPFKTGYKFSHWVVNNNVQDRIEAGATVNLGDGVKILKAVWEAESVTVELRFMTRVGTVDEMNFITTDFFNPAGLKFGDVITLPPIEDPNYTGRYRHMGWTFETSGVTAYTGTQIVLDETVVNVADRFRAVANSADAELGAVVRFFNEFSNGTKPATHINELDFDLGKTLSSTDFVKFHDDMEQYIPESMKKTHEFKGFFIVPEGEETARMHIDTHKNYFDPATGAYGKRSEDLPVTSNGQLILFDQSSISYKLESTSYSSITHFYMYLVPKAINISINYAGTGVSPSEETLTSYYGDQRARINLGSTGTSDVKDDWVKRIEKINASLTGGNVFGGWEVEYIGQDGKQIGAKSVFPFNTSTSSFTVSTLENLKLLTKKVDKDGLPVASIRVKPIIKNVYDFIVYVVDDGTLSGGQGSIYRVHYQRVLENASPKIVFEPTDDTVKSSVWGLGGTGGFFDLLNTSGFTITGFKTEDGKDYNWATIALGNDNVESPAQFDSRSGSIMLYAQYKKIRYDIKIINEARSAGDGREWQVYNLTPLLYEVGGPEFKMVPNGTGTFASWVSGWAGTRTGYYINSNGTNAISQYKEADRSADKKTLNGGATFTLNAQQFDLTLAEGTGEVRTLYFYIVWQKCNVTVIYYSGGVGEDVHGTVLYGGNVTLMAPPASWQIPIGHKFDGWKTKGQSGSEIILPIGVSLTVGEHSNAMQLGITENSVYNSSTYTYRVMVEARWVPRESNTIVFNLKGDATENVTSNIMHAEYCGCGDSSHRPSSYTVAAGEFDYSVQLPVAASGGFQNAPVGKAFDGWYFSPVGSGRDYRVDAAGFIGLDNEMFVDGTGAMIPLEFFVKWKDIDNKVFDLNVTAGIVLNGDGTVPFDASNNPVTTSIAVNTSATAYTTLLGKIEEREAVSTGVYNLNNIRSSFGFDGGATENAISTLASGYTLVGFAIEKIEPSSGNAGWHIVKGVPSDVLNYETLLTVIPHDDTYEVVSKMMVIPVYKVVMITVEFDMNFDLSGATDKDRPSVAEEIKTITPVTTTDSRTAYLSLTGVNTYYDQIEVPYDTRITLPYLASQHATDIFDDLRFYVTEWERVDTGSRHGPRSTVDILADSGNQTITFKAHWAKANSRDVITFEMAIPNADGSYSYHDLLACGHLDPDNLASDECVDPACVARDYKAVFYKKPNRAPIESSPESSYTLPSLSNSELVKFYLKKYESELQGMAMPQWMFRANNGLSFTDILSDSSRIENGVLTRPYSGTPASNLTVYLVFANVEGRVEFIENNTEASANASIGTPGDPFYRIPKSQGGTGQWGVDTTFGAEVPLIHNTPGFAPVIAPPRPTTPGWDLEFIGWTRYHEHDVPNSPDKDTIYNHQNRPYKLGFACVFNDVTKEYEYIPDPYYISGQTVTLYAVWEPKVIEVSFFINNQLMNNPSEQGNIYNNGRGENANVILGRHHETGVDGGGKYYLSRRLGVLPIPEITGFVFEKWTSADGLIAYSSEYVLRIDDADNANFYAKFIPNVYEIVFKVDQSTTYTFPSITSPIPFVNNNESPGQLTIPKYSTSHFSKDDKFAGWLFNGELIDTKESDVVVKLYSGLPSSVQQVNAWTYHIDVGAAEVEHISGNNYRIIFTADWSSNEKIEVSYSAGEGTGALTTNNAYLFVGDSRTPDQAGRTVGPNNSVNYMTYGVMIADDAGYSAPSGKNFGGWQVIRYDGKLAGTEGFPSTLQDGNSGKIFYPGEYLPGGLNKAVEFEAVWVEWTSRAVLEQGAPGVKVVSLGVDAGYLPSNYFLTNKLVFADSVEVVIIGRGFTRINQNAITAHSAKRVLLPSQEDLILEPQAILSGSLEQIYISDNLRGGVLGNNNEVSTNVPNIIGGAVIAPHTQLQVGSNLISNNAEYNLVHSSMTHYLVKQGTVVYDYEKGVVNLTGGTTKYFYVGAATSSYFGVLMSNNMNGQGVREGIKDLIAYPGAVSGAINVHDNVQNIKGFAFSYMTGTTAAPMIALTIYGASLRNVEAYALFSSNITSLRLPSNLEAGGRLDPAAVSGYLPRLASVDVGTGNLANFVNGILYQKNELGENTSVMYITHTVNATMGNITISADKHLTIGSNIKSIAPYALSSMFVTPTGASVVTSMEILGSGTRQVQVGGMSAISTEDEGRVDLNHFGMQSIAGAVLTSIEFGNGIKKIDGRIFEGWTLPGGLIISSTMQDRLVNADAINLPSAQNVYNRFPVLIKSSDGWVPTQATLDQFKTSWGAWAATDSTVLAGNSRVQAMLKQVSFNLNLGTAPLSVNEPSGNLQSSVLYGDSITLPNFTAAGYVLLGWRVESLNSDAQGKLFHPSWTRTVSMLTHNDDGYSTGTAYIERQISFSAVWERVKVQFIDGLGKDINWVDLDAQIITNWNSANPAFPTNPTLWSLRDATGYDFAGKKVVGNKPELDANGDLIDITEEVVFVLPGWDSGIGTTGAIANKAFVGWLKSDVELPSRNINWDGNAPSSDRILPDGSAIYRHPASPANSEIIFYALYDLKSNNITANKITSPTTFRKEVSVETNWQGGAVRIPAAIYDPADGYMSAVTYIAAEGFNGAWFIDAEVYIGSNVKEIGELAFMQAYITNVTFGINILDSNALDLEIKNNAFHNSTLKTIELPRRLTKIGIGAFSVSEWLTAVTMNPNGGPARLTTIGERAFFQCLRLATVFEIPLTVKRNDIPFAQSGTGIGPKAFGETAVTAFTSAVNVGAATIPTASREEKTYFTLNGNLCTQEVGGTRLISYAAGKAETSIAASFFINNEIRLVGEYGFSNAKITDITIPTIYGATGTGANLTSYTRFSAFAFSRVTNLNWVAIQTNSYTTFAETGVVAKEVLAGMTHSSPYFYVKGSPSNWAALYDTFPNDKFVSWDAEGSPVKGKSVFV